MDAIKEPATAAKARPRRAGARAAGGGAERLQAAAADPLDPSVIGSRVKALREAADLSLRDLAARSGVSAPMLSQVERGETSPTLTVASRIAAGLELRLSQLLRLDEGSSVTVVRAAQRQRGGNARRGHRFEVLTGSQPGQRAELSRHTLAAGGATGAADDPPMHEPGSRETALVEHGAVVLICDGQRYELAQGDCVTFDADLPHHFENPGAQEAAFLAVVSAGLRRS
ncbi:MAG TPA: XRE family transcriptional regulator [Solirubrobacteraceae bacterium]|jgi:transcriptional regulator with XRE-family HTH domain|nr:XRE family transcriptional regulator [Solirubrobacteraceae bacterium]